MGSCLPPATRTHLHHQQGRRLVSPPLLTSLASFYAHNQFTSSYIRTHPSILHFHRSFLLTASNPSRWSGRHCRANSPGPPSPPELDPPPGDNPPPSSDVMSSFSRAQDAVRIFFAVLFWMSLFFWSCVWDGKNDVRPNDRSRFRR